MHDVRNKLAPVNIILNLFQSPAHVHSYNTRSSSLGNSILYLKIQSEIKRKCLKKITKTNVQEEDSYSYFDIEVMSSLMKRSPYNQTPQRGTFWAFFGFILKDMKM